MKFILIILAAVAVVVLLKFGTIDPCGIVRAEVRQEAQREGGFGVLASVLPDGVIDSIIAAQYGQLSPGRCIALAFQGTPLRSPATPPPVSSAPAEPQVEHLLPANNDHTSGKPPRLRLRRR